MFLKFSQEMWNIISQNLSSLNPLKLTFLFDVELDSAEKKHACVWCMTYQKEEWLIKAEHCSLNSVLIEYDLKYCYNILKNNKANKKYLVLCSDNYSENFTQWSKEMCETDLDSYITVNLIGLSMYVELLFLHED